MFHQVGRVRTLFQVSCPAEKRREPPKLILQNLPPKRGRANAQQRYRLKNRAYLREKSKLYRLQNPEATRETSQRYRLQNTEAIRERKKRYWLQNREEILEKDKLKRREERKRKNLPPLNNWKEPTAVKQFFEEIAEKLGVKKQEDWYRVSTRLLCTVGGEGLRKRYGSIYYALQFAYPEVNWNQAKFSIRRKATTQWWLYNKVRDLLPGIEIFENHLHPNLFWEHGNKRIELDIWIPHYNLALEYQGEQHFMDNPRAFGASTVELYNELDSKKKRLCEAQGITLVAIPYWWDRKIESLASTLSRIRPDIFQAVDSFPIPSHPPEAIFPQTDNNPSLILMHGTNWTKSKHDPTGWWMSEKLDGIRAYWDGTRLLTRWGQSINAPLEFIAALPVGVPLDGELWCGYQTWGKISAILNRSKKQKNSLELWNTVTFCVFDAPLAKGTYPVRHEFLKTVISETSSIRIVPTERCEGVTHLEQSLSHIETKKGEGIMLYAPDTPYTPRRTSTLLKAKIYFSDHVEFMHRSHNSVALICRQKDGTECLVRCDRGVYDDPPQAGHLLMVRHSGISESSKKLIRAFLPPRDDLIEENRTLKE